MYEGNKQVSFIKLPIIDEDGFLKGLITIKDIKKRIEYPNSNKDAFGRLVVGGAIGVGVGDCIAMLQHSYYSVISPESCASILWSDPKKAQFAANSLKLDPNKALELKVIDSIIPEPTGGAHRDVAMATKILADKIEEDIIELNKLPTEELLENRFNKFRAMGNQTIDMGE